MTVIAPEGFWRSREAALFARYVERQRRRYEGLLEKMILKGMPGSYGTVPRPWLREQLRKWRDSGREWTLRDAMKHYNQKERGIWVDEIHAGY